MSSRLTRPHNLFKNRPLTDDVIAEVAPSIFATHPHQSRSIERYRFIPTSKVLKALREEGFLPYMVAQSNPRDEGRHGHAKHLIRLRQEESTAPEGGEYPEVVYIGSHDGTSASQLIGGYLRLVCTNGMVCGQDMGEIRVPHMGEKVISMIIKGAHQIVEQLKKMDEHRARMKEITLTEDEKGVFALDCLKVRYGDKTPPIEPDQLLVPHRYSDHGNNLWLIFNTIQEWMTKGGLHGRTQNLRRITTRPIRGIDQDIQLNRKLWDEAEKRIRIAA